MAPSMLRRRGWAAPPKWHHEMLAKPEKFPPAFNPHRSFRDYGQPCITSYLPKTDSGNALSSGPDCRPLFSPFAEGAVSTFPANNGFVRLPPGRNWPDLASQDERPSVCHL